MTDHKFTDDEIIKALKFCAVDKVNCIGCRFYIENDDSASGCRYLTELAISLIECQKAEIERLQRVGSTTMRRLVKARAEAIKEFAERAKESFAAALITGRETFPCDYVCEAIDQIAEKLIEKHDS